MQETREHLEALRQESYLNAYFVELEHDGLEKPFVLTEHSEYKWVDPKVIPELNFVDSDLQIYTDVMKVL